MININRLPDSYDIECGGATGASLRFSPSDSGVSVYLSAPACRPELIKLRWNVRFDREVSLLGDAWERSYGTLGFSGLSTERFMPWYFAASYEGGTDCVGVGVRPNAMICWIADIGGVTAICDVRSGGVGVELGDRELHVADFFSREYSLGAFEALSDFCALMSPDPHLPTETVWGGNNWYYAYGKSSRAEILADAALQAELSEGLQVRPFMVIDDGWQINSCAGPWEPNEHFGDMRSLADEFRSMGTRPGIWLRPLRDDSDKIPKEWRFGHTPYLDPSRPEVIAHVKGIIKRLTAEWGFELIKHDFSAFDVFGGWGFERGKYFTDGGWSFSDRTRTSAEIYKSLCEAIFDAAGGAYVLACNCVSHLVAGYCHINRTGDDTSGTSFDRTRRMGINTLAFRLPQNRRFYMVDADCAGFIKGKIPFELNGQWVDLLARSGTPLFISAPSGAFSPSELEFMKRAYKIASECRNVAKPLDWRYNATPALWEIDGERVEYDWFVGDEGVPFRSE